MANVKRRQLIKDLQLNDVTVKMGKFIDCSRRYDHYVVFHHTDWWWVEVDWFESKETKTQCNLF